MLEMSKSAVDWKQQKRKAETHRVISQLKANEHMWTTERESEFGF